MSSKVDLKFWKHEYYGTHDDDLLDAMIKFIKGDKNMAVDKKQLAMDMGLLSPEEKLTPEEIKVINDQLKEEHENCSACENGTPHGHIKGLASKLAEINVSPEVYETLPEPNPNIEAWSYKTNQQKLWESLKEHAKLKTKKGKSIVEPLNSTNSSVEAWKEVKSEITGDPVNGPIIKVIDGLLEHQDKLLQKAMGETVLTSETGVYPTDKPSPSKGMAKKKKKPLTTEQVVKLHEELKIAEKTAKKLNDGIASAKEVLKDLMITVEYSTNNSGGHWWLADKDWLALEQAGWKVQWGIKVFCHCENHGAGHNPPNTCKIGLCHGHHVDSFDDLCLMDRFLGAPATSATYDCIHLNQAIASWKSVINQDPNEEGCSCCGQPHYFHVMPKKKT